MLTPRLAVEVALENQLWRIKHAPTKPPRSALYTASIRPEDLSTRGGPDAAPYGPGSSGQQRADRLAKLQQPRSKRGSPEHMAKMRAALAVKHQVEDVYEGYQLHLAWKES